MQKKILVVEDQELVREILVFFLEAHYSLPIIEALSGKEAQKLLEEDSSIAIIISDFNMPNGTGEELFTYNNSLKEPLPFVMVSGNDLNDCFPNTSAPKQDASFKYIAKPWTQKNLQKILTPMIEAIELISEPLIGEASEFLRIRPRLLKTIDILPCDLFVKVNGTKYLKFIAAKDKIREHQDRIEGKKEEFLYIPKEHSQSVGLILLDMIFKDLESPPAQDIKSKLEAGAALEKIIKEIGISKQTIAYVDKLIDNLQSTIIDKIDLKKLMEEFKSNPFGKQERFISICYLSKHLMGDLTWANDQKFEKILYAAFFHDFFLEPELTQYHVVDQLFNKLPTQKKLLIKDHPLEVYNFLEDNSYIPADVGQICLQHHERPDGSGFPKRLDALHIAPLSALFILAEELAIIYQLGNESQLSDKEHSFWTQFTIGPFKQFTEQFQSKFLS